MASPSSPLPRRSAGSLASVLASQAMADLVTYFVLYSDAALHFRALQRATGLSSRSLQHELARLERMGLIQREREGRLVRYRAVADHPRWAALRELVRQFAEPAALLRVALSAVPGIDAAFIFGSCARGDMHEDSDIDVFALGERLEKDMDTRLALAAGTLESSFLLRREVNLIPFSRKQLEARRTGGFLRSVFAGEKMWLVGDEAILGRWEEA
jgi:predicted nucleotidyltransferase